MLINVRMLTEGVDVPDVKTVFITRDTNSTILFTQMVGRALRGEKAGGNKSTANIVMFTDDWNRHIHFASSRMLGGKEDSGAKERGHRPLELIRIDLLDSLELEYQRQEYEKSIFDLLPIGWYVVIYTDTVEEEDEMDGVQKVTESFVENVVVLEEEESLFKNFIDEYPERHRNILWEKEELDFANAERLISEHLGQKGHQPNRATITKLIQIARHLGQNNSRPEYFTFDQKNEVDVMRHVRLIREKNWGRDQAEEYLEQEYHKAENPFLKVIFPSYEDFYRAYEYEDNVYRRARKGSVSISESGQEVLGQRLAGAEVRRIVHSRDGHRCLCCGKSNNLQIDHIISFKEQQPEDDSPELYQTLCGVCNREKSSHSYNYRITHYDRTRMALENVQSTPNEDPMYYLTRLVNCYFKTSAVHMDSVHAMNHGRSVWKITIKYGADPNATILNEKDRLLQIVKSKGYRFKDIEITVK